MKPKLFKNKFSDIEIEVLKNGWTVIIQGGFGGEESISLGQYPNARFELLEQMLEYVKKEKKQND